MDQADARLPLGARRLQIAGLPIEPRDVAHPQHRRCKLGVVDSSYIDDEARCMQRALGLVTCDVVS